MIEQKPVCPLCSAGISIRAVVFGIELACPSCSARLRVPLIYQANVAIGSFASAVVTTYVLDVGPRFVNVLFLLTFVFALFVATTVVPLVPPKLDA